ncbi:MAG TPA: calcineurin-like phosphoesterase family protein [Luteimonas sp.]|nr:calcineurin-like phosphoesterase family protein [Luteimonas sp.]
MNQRVRGLSVLLALASAPACVSSPGPATGLAAPTAQAGHVFEDENGNGRMDPGEAGVAGVAVSDGRAIVRTDATGRYALHAAGGDMVFVVKPAGWAVPAGPGGLPSFWKRAPGAQASARNAAALDFALAREGMAQLPGSDLEVLVFADPQVGSARQVDYYARDVIDGLRHGDGRIAAAGARAAAPAQLGLTLGDVVDDAPALYAAVNAVTASLGVPWLHAPGNHDLDAGDSDAAASASYRRVYGPDTFAWEARDASFVMLDDVVALPGQRPAYVGGLREDQWSFLQAYLATHPRDRLLVLGMHIPLFDTAAPGRAPTFRSADRARLFALLRPFQRVLVLTGHRHTQRHYRHGTADGWQGAQPLHEYNVGAVSGAFWSGKADAAGIPDATMDDGTPNGHARLRIAPDGGYRLSWHPARLPPDDAASTAAMSVHAPKVLRRGAYPAWGAYANVYMGEADTRVEARVDGGAWQPMQRVLQPDPRLLLENARDDTSAVLRGFDRSPEAEPSQHLWRIALPTTRAAGDHLLEVRAFDRWHGEQRARTSYRLDDAEP